MNALTEIDNKKTIPTLMELLNSENTHSLPTIARTLNKLGDTHVIEPIIQLLEQPEKKIKIETINALAQLADDKHADSMRSYIQNTNTNATDETIQHTTMRALKEIDNHYSNTAIATTTATTTANLKTTKMAEPARTLLIEKNNVDQIIKKTEETTTSAIKMDITTLKNNNIIKKHYKYIEKINKNTFDTIVLIEDTIVNEQLILKFLNPNITNDEEMMKHFVHELRYSHKITHKNIIHIYDFLYMRDNYAISMEYFPNHTLNNEIVNEKPLPLPHAIQYGIDITTNMTIAHQINIMHRDLKPTNIMINNEKLLKILNFNVATTQKENDTQLTKTNYMINSPKYITPKQILNKKIDQRTDIYNIGMIMYEIFTNQPPYNHNDHISIMYQHMQNKTKTTIDINPQLPQKLSDLIGQTMSINKMKHHQTMEELRLTLEKLHQQQYTPLRITRIDAFLKLNTDQNCSDIHFTISLPPLLRMHGDLMPIKFRDLNQTELKDYVNEIINKPNQNHLHKNHNVDFSYISSNSEHFHINVFHKNTNINATFHAIPTDPPTLEQLELPPIVKKLCNHHQNMILITNSTNTNKSTTLATMIDHLNSTQQMNIINLEDPIEFVHKNKQNQIIQHELNTHLPSFSENMRTTMHEDPDIILINELHDTNTIHWTMTTTETNHLILNTLHTTGTMKTIDHIVDTLPTDEHEQTKNFLSQNLITMITQMLMKTADQHDHKTICEIILLTRTIGKLIMTDQTHQIPTQLQTNRDLDMQMLDQTLLTNVQSKKIDPDDTYVYANDKHLFSKFMTDTNILPKFDLTPN